MATSCRTFAERGAARPVALTRLAAALVAVVLCLAPLTGAVAPPDTLPARLSDADFWRLVERLSEPSGYFQSDNLVSNERLFQNVVPALHKFRRGGAYLGVAPDQNFTYILGIEPKIAFIVDIRRGNLHTQLMYKALIELSKDRVEFVSRLFSRARPDDLPARPTASQIFAAFEDVPPSDDLFQANYTAIVARLVKTRGFGLSEEDLAGIQTVYGMFHRFGPEITYSSSTRSGSRGGRSPGRGMPTYAELQTASDAEGRNQAYLGSEENFRALKAFQEKNLLVPVVGDFAGPKALRSVGQYLADHGATVTVFYVSNVEQYLFQNGVAQAFYANVATLPMDDDTAFLRSARTLDVLDPMRAFLRDFSEGRIGTWQDVTRRGRDE
jgi:hypothetical protein